MPASSVLSAKFAQNTLARIDSRGQWRKLWDCAQTQEEHLSLLHWGLRTFVDVEAFLEQVCFYLDIADGYRCCELTREEEETILPVAQAAWKELCLFFFEKKSEDKYLQTPRDIPVVEKLIWFFDPDRNNNIPAWDSRFPEHIRRIGARVWRDLCWVAWRGSADSYHIEEKYRELLRPTFEALHALRPKLLQRLLLEPNGIETLLSLPAQADTLPYLRKKALEESRAFIDSIGTQKRFGPYISLEEAIRAGRKVAEVCLILETRLKPSTS